MVSFTTFDSLKALKKEPIFWWGPFIECSKEKQRKLQISRRSLIDEFPNESFDDLNPLLANSSKLLNSIYALDYIWDDDFKGLLARFPIDFPFSLEELPTANFSGKLNP